jgi:hypothetical protein
MRAGHHWALVLPHRDCVSAFPTQRELSLIGQLEWVARHQGPMARVCVLAQTSAACAARLPATQNAACGDSARRNFALRPRKPNVTSGIFWREALDVPHGLAAIAWLAPTPQRRRGVSCE